MITSFLRTLALAGAFVGFGAGAFAQESSSFADARAASASQSWSAAADSRTPLASATPTRMLPFSVLPALASMSPRVPVGEMPAAGPLDYQFHNAGGN